MASLRDTQKLFWRLITAPEGVNDGLRRIDMKPDELAAVVHGDDRLDATARLDIYANMYFFRLLDILRGDYPSVLAVVGDDRFHNLVTEYLVDCPSRHPSVRNVGARLPGYLGQHALGVEQPWLAELALLERTRLELFDGPDADPLTVDELRALPPDAFASLKLPLVPAHRLLELRYAVDHVWRAVDAGLAEGEVPAPPEPSPRTLIVWRHDVMIYHRPLEALERPALARARDGASFGLICELLAASMPAEEAAPAAFRLLSGWLTDGLIARVPDPA